MLIQYLMKAAGIVAAAAGLLPARLLSQSFGVAVTPAEVTITVAGDSRQTQRFWVKNTGTAGTRNYAIMGPACNSPVHDCVWSTFSLTIAQGDSGAVDVTFTAGPNGTTGTTHFDAVVNDQQSVTARGVVFVQASSTPPPDGVTVTPNSGTEDVPPYSPARQKTFTVKNTSGRTVDISIQGADCQPFEMSCAFSTQSISGVPPNGEAPVTVTYTSGRPGWSGSIALVAKINDNQSVSASAAVTVQALAQAWLETKSLNPGTTISRAVCVSVPVATNSAYECGDLTIAHALPSLRIRGDDRTPILRYVSTHGTPTPVVAANVSAPTGGATNVMASLSVRRGGSDVQVVAPTSFGSIASGTTRRIALAYDASSDTTGIYPYTLTVTMTVGGIADTLTSSDTLVVVNRQGSAFGGGWWLAGYERLIPVPGGNFLWVGGDGSTRLYVRDTLRSGEAYGAAGFDRPDSLVREGQIYVRQLRHRARVEFDLAGRHVVTRDPLGIATTFQHDGSGRLEKIVHPTPAAPFHQFFYNLTTGRLDSVTGPGPTGGTRRVQFTMDNGAVFRITDPDGRSVQFGTNSFPGFDIISRVNRNGYVSTFTLASNRLVSANVPLADPNQDQIITVCPAEIRGLLENGCDGGSVAVDSAVTTIDGPRVGTADMTRVVTNRFGAPVVVTDPLGSILRLFRGNRGFPALVTRTVQKNGWVNDASFDERGLPAARVEYGPLGPGRGDAVTQYNWDPKWERVASVKTPAGDSVSFAYDTATGNRIWQQPGSDPVRRVSFAYDSSGAADGLLRSVTYPSVKAGRIDRDSIAYDPLGNVASVRATENANPLSISRFISDDAGRQFSACVDIVLNGAHQCTTTKFDVMDRDSVVTVLGDAVGSSPTQSVVVATTFNAEGNPLRIVRTPSDGQLQPQITRLVYDQGERLIADTAADGAVERHVYDEASNLITVITRRGDTLSMTYDDMNRLKTRSVSGRLYVKEDSIGMLKAQGNDRSANGPFPRKPNAGTDYLIASETHEFDYNELGLVTSARNGDAHVARTYFPNGLIASETDSIRTVAGGDLSQHVYRVGYEYDLNGRLHALHYPSQLVQSPSNSRDSVTYSYDPQTGQLAQVNDLLGNTFTYTYDNAGQVARLDRPGSVRELFAYDGAGRVTGDTIRNLVNILHRGATFTYGDARGKITASSDSGLKREQLQASYSGLGFLVASQYSELGIDFRGFPQNFASADSMTYDALGNLLLSQTAFANATSAIEDSRQSSGQNYLYNATTGRLGWTTGNPRSDSLVYDAAGNVHFQFTRGAGAATPNREDRMAYYAGDGKLRAVDRRTKVGTGGPYTFTFEEYWYDALGRRIVTRTQRDCADTEEYDLVTCSISTARRTVWGGSRELFEIQMPDTTMASLVENDTALLPNLGITKSATKFARNPFFGRVAYSYGPGLDEPLSVTRWGFADTLFTGTATEQQFEQWREPFGIIPQWNIRGQASNGTAPNGALVFGCGGGKPLSGGASSGRCAKVFFPYGWTAYWQKMYQQPSWHGSLLDEKRDGSSLIFKRNRYYDPETARFTQEDPIGLAGGLNLYGFASGDPVNFGDPFGLCPPEDDKPCPGELIKRAMNNAVDAFVSLYLGTLDAISDAIDYVIPVKSLATAAGLNPNEQRTDARVSAALSAAMSGLGPLVPEGGRPALKLLHEEKTLSKIGLDYFRKRSTEDIVRSLEPGGAEPLIVNARGTVLQGNHRIFVLMERGFDVNTLPRTPYP